MVAQLISQQGLSLRLPFRRRREVLSLLNHQPAPVHHLLQACNETVPVESLRRSGRALVAHRPPLDRAAVGRGRRGWPPANGCPLSVVCRTLGAAGQNVVRQVDQLRVLERVRMVAAVRVPVLELPPPGGVQLRLRGVGGDAEHEVVVGYRTAIARRGRTSFVYEAEPVCGSAVSHGAQGLWQAPRHWDNGYADSRFYGPFSPTSLGCVRACDAIFSERLTSDQDVPRPGCQRRYTSASTVCVVPSYISECTRGG